MKRTEQKDDETNIYRWTQELYEQKKAEARQMEVSKLPAFIEECMKRCERDDQTVGAMVLAGLAACVAALKCRKQKPHPEHVAQAALFLYKEIVGMPGPFRVISYNNMLRPGFENHFSTVVDWQSAMWLAQEANTELMVIPGLDPSIRDWLGRIALGVIPYGWSAEKPPVPDGFKPVGHRA